MLCLSIKERESKKQNAFQFKEISFDHVYTILNSSRASKAIDLDNLSARLIKDGARSIAPLITHIMNVSTAQGKVPDEIKRARVVPLHKKVSRTDPSTYIPISILSTISKVTEKVIYAHVETY